MTAVAIILGLLVLAAGAAAFYFMAQANQARLAAAQADQSGLGGIVNAVARLAPILAAL